MKTFSIISFNCIIATLIGLLYFASLIYLIGLEAKYFSFSSILALAPKSIFGLIVSSIVGQLIISIIPCMICAFIISLLRPKKLYFYSLSAITPFVLYSIYSMIYLEKSMWYFHTYISFAIGVFIPLTLFPILLFIFYRLPQISRYS